MPHGMLEGKYHSEEDGQEIRANVSALGTLVDLHYDSMTVLSTVTGGSLARRVSDQVQTPANIFFSSQYDHGMDKMFRPDISPGVKRVRYSTSRVHGQRPPSPAAARASTVAESLFYT
ncbi:MAG: hypothetical protein HETSPECPRED_004377 [Heterodermia speciosa]|uniref:Uncharacterized protein n=1 Tax=Heterodermia speciosa TaxID=116794 RepID=A0A8H3IJ94_9LECA|nr:MAG: hypothetical protein HETSPECPRED_004377 [Heterodermia speciosa]